MDPVTLTLQPGQNGTKQLTARYGQNLICVRHRRTASDHSYKTIELRIPDDLLLAPDVNYAAPQPSEHADLVFVQVHWHEQTLQQTLKHHGARWLQKEKYWQIEKHIALKLDLAERIVQTRATTQSR